MNRIRTFRFALCALAVSFALLVIGASGLIVPVTPAAAVDYIELPYGDNNMLWTYSTRSINYYLPLVAGERILITMKCGYVIDIGLRVFGPDSATAPVAQSENYASNEQILFTAPKTGVYTINTHLVDGNGGHYELYVDRYPTTGGIWYPQTSTTGNHLRDIDFVSPSIGWAVADHNVIIKTISGGQNWVTQWADPTTGNIWGWLGAVDFIDANTGWVVGNGGLIMKTTNGGRTWVTQASGTFDPLYDVQFVSPTTGFIVGYEGRLYKTTNGGLTWVPQVSGTANSLRSVYFVSPSTGWAVGNLGTILKTTNGGTTWTPQASGTTTAGFESVSFTDSLHGWVAADAGLIVTTSDGGSTWTRRDTGLPATWLGIDAIGASSAWAVGTAGAVAFTTDGGSTWTTQTSGTTEPLFKVHMLDPWNGWAVGNRGTLLRYDATTQTMIGIRSSAATARTGSVPILSGWVSPNAMIGKNIVVYVRKPGKAYFSYSSNRTVYNLKGTAAWQYKYYFKPGMAKGNYVFKASVPAYRPLAGSDSLTWVSIVLR